MSLSAEPSGAESGGPAPLYRRIAEELRRRMSAGELAPGQGLPSLRSLARKYRTGVFTVRSALDVLRREGRVRLGRYRRAQVLDIEKLPGRMDNLVVLINTSDLGRLFAADWAVRLIEGLGHGLDERGGGMVALAGRHFKEHLPAEVLELPVRGVVLFGGFARSALERYARLAVPVVHADCPGSGGLPHSVAFDNVAAGEEVARQMLGCGHRRALFVRYLHILTGEADPDDVEREAAIVRVLTEAGLPRSALSVFNTYGDSLEHRDRLRGLLREKREITVVIVGGRRAAAAVEEAAAASGRRVPADLSIVCFEHDCPETARYAGPRADFVAMGRRAIELLDAPATPPVHERVPTGWNGGETLVVAR